MDLKELLGEELYSQVQDKLGDKKIDIVSEGNWIPKEKFDQVNEDKKSYKKQVEDLNQDLGKLKDKLKDNEDATKTIDDLKEQIADKETELAKTRKQNAIKLEVLKANPNDVADILPHLKDDSISINEDGSITGLKEQLENLQENKAYLFKEEGPSGTGGSIGNKNRKKTSVNNPWSKENFNLTEQGKLLKEDPERAKQLMAEAGK